MDEIRSYFRKELWLAGQRMINLGMQMIRVWGVIVFVLALMLHTLQNFGPGLIVEPSTSRVTTLLSILFIAWTLFYMGFLQRKEAYNYDDGRSLESVTSNKSITTYLIGVVVLMGFWITESLVGSADTAVLAIFGVLQLFTLFFGDSFQEQAENLMPFLSSVMLLIAAMYLLSVG